jgi:hypothetical protein
VPYVLEQMRLAKMSFDMFGALSPSEAKKELPSKETEELRDKSPTNKPTATSRSISQAELESSLFKVTSCRMWTAPSVWPLVGRAVTSLFGASSSKWFLRSPDPAPSCHRLIPTMLYPEDGASRFLGNVGFCLPNYMASQYRRQ